MIESFVDLTYRGLALGRRIKLTNVRPTTAYLELPMPMPVGTLIGITTDEGVALEATVTAIHEQVGGSDRMPGMIVKPALGSEATQSWWQARVALPDEAEPQPPARSRPITVRPRSHTVPGSTAPAAPVTSDAQPLTKEVTETKELSVFVAEQEPLSKEVTETKELSVFVAEQPAPPPPVQAPAYAPPEQRPVDDAKRTMVMSAVDQEMLAKLTQSEGEVEHLVRRTGEHEVVDDGLRTTVMDAVDPAALGLDVSASGSMPAVPSEDDGSSTKTPPSGVKKRKKKR